RSSVLRRRPVGEGVSMPTKQNPQAVFENKMTSSVIFLENRTISMTYKTTNPAKPNQNRKNTPPENDSHRKCKSTHRLTNTLIH
ncbi:MAG: hypothetical protein OIF40_12375, partial [Mangrovicoccus sp.]|nr:hypothetical protein [Mangrovicoccus sp.]